ncbi:zinc ribbon domain-containing protein [Amnibacterium sp. CER49]|uniref:FmdB family zinc ribbon protein n=1 Tax=Amnibacterium sp. CER49 TaxID=3039161 RepID=UPI002449B48E|nr:FmdB family zinc ribbon protein [Amnibacterium sp. CER49]MDH2444181.1 zinc ribbon domain-containing protein [Amnibacterium sp. CER49]
MPVYAYKCRDCGTPLEVHQEFSDAALTVCPTCGGTLRKQYGSIGVTFNGSGFYRTDSREGAKKGDGAAKADAATKSDGASTSPTSAPAAPAKSDSGTKTASTPAS